MLVRRLKCMAIFTLFVFGFCEWFIYYIVLYQCSWPKLSPEKPTDAKGALRVMMLADTHLLGPIDGHWFDKLRREWQMRRTFQTALTLFRPEAVFVLGDLFDEGMACSDEEFEDYFARFNRLFYHPDDIEFHVVFGNHDIGFHDRFKRAFNIPPAQLLRIKGNLFVFVNSIGLEGDSCSMCNETVSALYNIASRLHCDRNHQKRTVLDDGVLGKLRFDKILECEIPRNSPAPILIQHYPLYRPNEADCIGPDAPPPDKRTETNRPRWEVVSQEASSFLLSTLQPRLVVSGHTHHGCYLVHEGGIPELTIPSFSWRNRNNPSFILAVITPENYVLGKCFMPEESTVIYIYIFSGLVLLIMNLSIAITGLRRFIRRCRRQMYRQELQGVATRY
ncbi:predicted protein [Nematostella vectensis]|uniref:Calcineurin-like phosphoesterase domain-containing protein n=1 Tax=Nematostella vectensis TaxID=45351 RepID=A7RME0_NEMVE|nr:predicted protein [Nematostella vectensis]|eukprot:XP_001639388.1 predicted protein [Nematostella vectensis]